MAMPSTLKRSSETFPSVKTTSAGCSNRCSLDMTGDLRSYVLSAQTGSFLEHPVHQAMTIWSADGFQVFYLIVIRATNRCELAAYSSTCCQTSEF